CPSACVKAGRRGRVDGTPFRIHHQAHPPAFVVEAGAVQAGVLAGPALAEHADPAGRHQLTEALHAQAKTLRHHGAVDFDVRLLGKLKGYGIAHGVLHASGTAVRFPFAPGGRIDLGQARAPVPRAPYHGALPSPEFSSMSILPSFIRRPGLVTQIAIGLVAGVVLALVSPGAAAAVGLLGTVFISALKAVAPVLVLVLVAASIANHRQGQDTRMRPVLALYLVGTALAALVGVAASFLFPTTLALDIPPDTALSAPGGIGEVLRTLVLQVFDNPFNALVNANYIGLLAWGIVTGLALRQAGEGTKQVLSDFSDAITRVVRMVIRLAPL